MVRVLQAASLIWDVQTLGIGSAVHLPNIEMIPLWGSTVSQLFLTASFPPYSLSQYRWNRDISMTSTKSMHFMRERLKYVDTFSKIWCGCKAISSSAAPLYCFRLHFIFHLRLYVRQRVQGSHLNSQGHRDLLLHAVFLKHHTVELYRGTRMKNHYLLFIL